jgi:hypothetical protein
VHVFAHAYVRVRACVRAWLLRVAREVRPLGGSTGLSLGSERRCQVTLNVMTTYIALLESNKAVRVAPSP